MKEINISRFSSRCTVRRMTLEDIDTVFDLLIENQPYFLCCGSQPTKESVQSDLTVGPPGIPAEQKYYLGFFRDNTLLAVTDLIDGYPEDRFAFIGFFMLRLSAQGAGEGSRLIGEMLSHLQALGYEAVRLGIDKNNTNGIRFWTKNGFEILKEIVREDSTVLYAERKFRTGDS